MSGYIIVSAFISALFILVGLVVFTRNASNRSNQLFLAFSAFTALWLVTNYLSSSPETSKKVALATNHIVLAAAGASILTMLLFCIYFFKFRLRFARTIIAVSAIGAAGTLFPIAVRSVRNTGDTYAIEFGWFAGIYFATLIADAVLTIVILALVRFRSTGIKKSQANSILLSLGASFAGLLTTNAIIPFAFKNYSLTSGGSFFSALIVAGVAYTIVRHKLFDIKLVVARSLGYAFSVGVLSGGYALTTYLLTSLLFSNLKGGASEAFINILLLLVASISYAPIKRFFDKATNTLFYKDAYDSQKLLDEISNVVLSNTEVGALLEKATTLMRDYLKTSYVYVILHQTTYQPQRVIGDVNDLNKHTIRSTIAELLKIKQRIVVADSLQEDDSSLFTDLSEQKIGVFVRLTQNLKTKDESTGYVFIGSKRSGNPFNRQDIEVIGIITSELTIAIQNVLRFEEIQNFSLTLQAKVDEQTRTLRRTNEKLKTLDETKDDFISMASHQLRTPLTSVKGYISMVLEEDAGKVTPMQREMLGQAFFSSQRMVYLIADLLNVSRLKTGKFIIDAHPVKLDEVVQQELQQLEETAAARELTLHFDKPASFPAMMLDETKTRQVIMNFVDNAIYYTPTGGHITVRLVETPTNVELRVEDNGIGVPKSEQPHLFTKFYRAGNARQARPDGTGLGLFMAKKVVVAQGGSVLFESEEGKGSTFGFIFSKDKLAAPAPNAAPKATPPLSKAKKPALAKSRK